MEPKSYQYSLLNCLAWFLNCAIYGYLLSRVFRPSHTLPPFWLYVGIFAIAIWTYRFFEQLMYYFIPFILGRTAFKLDSEGLSYRSKTVGWQEIKEIKVSTMGTRLKLILNDRKKVRINLNIIKGNDAEIHRNLLTYFEKSKTQ